MPHKKGHCLTEDGNIIEDCMDAMNSSEYAKYNPVAEQYRGSRNPVEEHVANVNGNGNGNNGKSEDEQEGYFGIDYTGEGEHGTEHQRGGKRGSTRFWGY